MVATGRRMVGQGRAVVKKRKIMQNQERSLMNKLLKSLTQLVLSGSYLFIFSKKIICSQRYDILYAMYCGHE